MPEPVLTTHELLAWLEKTSTNWHELLKKHPDLLTLPCDIMNVSTAGQHIVAVELRYAQRLADLPVTEYATHDRAMAILHQLLATDIDWDAPIEFNTRAMGLSRSTRKALLFHTLMHSIRHYAQLATLARQNGIKPHWGMDYLLMHLEPA